MPLTLTIRNADALENGSPLSLILDRRGAIIGRAATSDWWLPDPSLHISSRHCEIQYREGAYVLNDTSTNGTFLIGSESRLPGPHTIRQGDSFLIGHFEIAAALDEATASAQAARNAAPPPPQWQGWEARGGGDAPGAQPISASGWGAPPAGSAISGTGPMSQNWAVPSAVASPASQGWEPPPAAPQASPPPATDEWGSASAAPPPEASPWNAPSPGPESASNWSQDAPASDWSTPAAPPPPPSGDDIWGAFAASNVVDWARGGFAGSTPPVPPPVQAPVPASLAENAAPLTAAGPDETPQPTPAPAPAHPPAAGGTGGLAELLAAAGLTVADLKQDEGETLRQTGRVIKLLVAGLVVLLEARARAKSQLGAQGTSLEFDGNNPLKFARSPEQALALLLNPAERGFMPAERAIEDSFRDLQAHQMATLKAMQGALRASLDRFSPQAIRARASQGGVLSKILPGSRDAALWAAYEREFSGVAQGSNEAFMDVFAKEFRIAYEEISRRK